MKISPIRIGRSFWLIFFAGGLLASDIRGTVQLKKNGIDKPIDKKDEVIVFISRHVAAIPPRLLQKSNTMVTRKKQFSPRLLIIPVGATVQFPNLDPIIHNVFSVSGKNRFDAGRFGKGGGKAITFKYPGLVRIYCNVHHQMNAAIHIIENPFLSKVDTRGRFEIKNIPAGTYQISAIHHQGSRRKQDLTVPKTGSVVVDIRLSLVKKKAKPHLNKFGKPYKRKRAKRY